MEKVVRKFKSFDEAEEADIEEWLNKTPAEKLSVLQDLREEAMTLFPQHFKHLRDNNESGKRLQRVYRVVKQT